MTITEKQINLIGRRKNAGKALGEELQALYKVAEEEGIEVTEEQAQKGFDWIVDQYKSPRGVVRKNNPYGYREEEAIDSGLQSFTYDGHYNAGRYNDWYTPIYSFLGKNGQGFQYYVAGGKIEIIG